MTPLGSDIFKVISTTQGRAHLNHTQSLREKKEEEALQLALCD